MRLLDRYIGREVFFHALLGLVIFTFVLFVPQLVRLMELGVRHSAGPATIGRLVLYTLPGVFTFTIPMAVLVGVLLGLGRLSADSETIALNALGLGLRRIVLPVAALGLAAAALTLFMSNWLSPAGLRRFRALENELKATQASFEVQPRVFDERFPRLVLYIQDVEAAGTRWRGLLLAEAGGESGSSRLTLANEAIIVPGGERGRFQLSLRNGSTHEYSSREPDRYSVSTFGQSDVPISVAPSAPLAAERVPLGERALAQLSTPGPWHDPREAGVEFHRRFALPAACLVFALAGVPMGARPRRGGRAIGALLTVLLICGYYLLFIVGVGMARRGAVSPFIGLWTANLLTALAALIALPRMEQIHEEGLLGRIGDRLRAWRSRPASASGTDVGAAAESPAGNGRPLFPQTLGHTRVGRALGFPLLLDLYLLRSFFGSLLLMLLGFIFLFHLFTFFELLNDVARNSIPLTTVAGYFLFLTPHLLYQVMPLAALVAVLVTLGVLAKNNEVTAFQAGGTSLYRLALPLLVAGLFLAGGMMWLDHSILPFSNQKQDALRNHIKGRPAQTFFQPRRQWIFGLHSRLYNYDYFDPDLGLFGGLSVYALDPQTFHMRRRVHAARAHWEPHLGTWILEEGWVRDFEGDRITRFTPFRVITLGELTEPPGYFQREVRQSYQMNWQELRSYIVGLEQAGFDVARFTVHLHRKFAFPLLAPIVIFLGIPFAFLVGTRGALGGIATALAIGIVYWAASAFFEALGATGQLPPLLAAWAPDAIFTFAGAYFFLKMPT
jgi:LPS export ABC transporter permease LptF/LPS export ABC transporter permease LptG